MVHPQQQSIRTSSASSLLQWRSQRTHEQSWIPCDQLWQNADIQDAVWISKTWMQETTVCIESHGCKRHRTTSSVPSVLECAAQRHWLWSESHELLQSSLLKLDRVQKEAICRVFLSTTKTHPLRPCTIYWTCHQWKQARRWNKSKCISVCAESQKSTPWCCQRRNGM